MITVKRLDDAGETWHAPTDTRPDGYLESGDIPYLVMGAKNRIDAIAAVMRQTPETYNGVALRQVRFDGWDGAGAATVSAVYNRVTGYADGDEDEEPVMSYDCGGGTKHMTHAYAQTRVYGGDVDDADGMIGWNGKPGAEAEYEGVDVPCADMRLTLTKRMKVSKATSTSFMKTSADIVGKVNADAYRGWEPGELMFLGCSYSTPLKGARYVTVAFNFRAMRNERDCTVAGHKVGSKEGFDYMWARSETVADEDTGKMVNRVAGIFKSSVCLRENFSKLGI